MFSCSIYRKRILKKYLKLENGIPSSDTILRALARIDAKQLEKVFIDYAREAFGKKLAEKIAEKKADYVISLKGNQQSIHNDVKEFFDHPCDEAYCERYNIQHIEYRIEIGHGRIEKRTCYLCRNLNWLTEKDEWSKLNAVGMLMCERTVKKSGKKSIEQRYFLTSLTDVEKAAFAMRAHWGIENNLHWVLDAILNEDYCLVWKDNAAANLHVLRKIVLNILKQVDFSDIIKAKKMPLCHKQHLCDKREDCLERALQSL